MSLEHAIQSLLIGISIAAIPGPIFFELTRRTLTYGFWNGASLAFGEFIGNSALLILIFFGMSRVLDSIAARTGLYLIGAAVLIGLGIAAWRINEEELRKPQNKTSSQQRNSLVAGAAIALSSPIVIALWVSLSGSYLNEPMPLANILLVTVGFLVFFLPLAAIIHVTRSRIPDQYIVLLSKIFGIVLIGYGAWFVYELVMLVIGII